METLSSVSSFDQKGLPEAYSEGSGTIAWGSPATVLPAASTRLTLDAILAANKTADYSVDSALGHDESKPLGIFYGVWSVFLLYVGAGVVAAVGYEIWCLLTR